MGNRSVISYLETLSTIIIAVTVFLLPVLFFTSTTDFFVVPKQILIIASALILITLWGARLIIERRIVVTSNPLNLPVLIFGAVLFVSSFLSRNRFDSLIQTVPALLAILYFYIIVNTVKTMRAQMAIVASLLLGAAVSSLIAVSYSFKFYFLPITTIQSPLFNTFGSTIQHLIYIIPAFAFILIHLAKSLGFPKFKISENLKNDYGFFALVFSGISVTLGIALIAYQIILSPNKPILLPYIYGFQTAFASISQEAQRFIVSLMFGSGYGTFITDFTRFKLASFNLEQNIWNLSFAFSSSYLLELIATAGLLGVLSYIAIIIFAIRARTPKSPLFAALIVTFILSIVLPFAYSSVAMLFILLGLYVSSLNIAQDKKVYDIALSLVASKRGMWSFETTQDTDSRKFESAVLPAIVFLLVLLLVGFVGFFTFKFVVSDIKFSESLRQAGLNNAQKTYQLEAEALTDFPYRADYHRIFSQINLALANSLAANVKEGSSANAQLQQNILTLLQQSINSARNAVILAPMNSVNWQNLSQVYRSLINVGQNAEQFAIASVNQAIALDPYNPNLYIQLGGIYFQLRQWDNAQNQFQVAINLKRDFANAYYNLGHTFEEKGDLTSALNAYQIVKQLSADNKDNLARIEEEIKTLEARLGEQAQQAKTVAPETEQTPLSISQPSAKLPAQKPPVKISPPPTGTAQTTPTPSPSTSPTP